jgi:AraC-like DNA-binding protein
MSRYFEYAPSDALRPFVDCFWTREAAPREGVESQPVAVQRVLPDGCMDVILAFSGRADEPESAMVVGTMTKALVLDAAAAPECFVGVRFRPAKAAPFLSLPASEITDLRVSLEDVWGDAAGVRAALSEGASAVARVRAFDRVLRARLSASAASDARLGQRDVDEAVRRIIEAGGSLGITRLAPSLGVSRQHLARRFAQLVGVSPKVFARVVRLGRVIECVRAVPVGERINWSVLALELGYYDQSHLVDEFREMTGVTPTAWTTSGNGETGAGNGDPATEN